MYSLSSKDVEKTIEIFSYVESHNDSTKKLMEQLEKLQEIISSDKWVSIYENWTKYQSILLSYKIMDEANRISRLVKKIKQKYKNLASDDSKDIFPLVKKILKKANTFIKKLFRFFKINDRRKLIFMLKNFFRHFDDEEDLKINNKRRLIINFNLSKNEFKNRIKTTNKLCTDTI
ncbi:hypothetical protein ACQ7CX_08455 [Chryseobacterium arthrosphaerae]|uniref:hypothetical protein n=1 Tax=Chryseobacterium arthrosphaerae TaxID=651561 RepID=UPI001BAE62BA|nr:hypothetical protein [Chryseobacterium arthrosphaerae]QUY56511.1 hypothetical protein I2F65_04000 [Chryseobacterium arthrosphaerae]